MQMVLKNYPLWLLKNLDTLDASKTWKNCHMSAITAIKHGWLLISFFGNSSEVWCKDGKTKTASYFIRGPVPCSSFLPPKAITKVVFFIANCTSKLQLLDLKIFTVWKLITENFIWRILASLNYSKWSKKSVPTWCNKRTPFIIGKCPW